MISKNFEKKILDILKNTLALGDGQVTITVTSRDGIISLREVSSCFPPTTTLASRDELET